MRSDAIKPGDVIAGKYRVRAILSRSRGFLVEAFHTEFDQRAVIRVLSPNLVDDKEVERFRREARTLAKLESEHVARILDVGTTNDGAFYFARQYLEGQDLAMHLKQRGPLPLAEAVLYVLQAAEAVAETHVHNIILRELQPAHLFLTQRLGSQQIKVIDFGTAKLMRENAAPTAGGELTATAMFGLSCYSSPELVRKAKHVDVRTDVWSLGAILYQLLAGRPPFGGELAALMLAITRDEPRPLTQVRRDLPADLDSIIGWALAKDPDGRFANVHGFAHALLPFTSTEGQLLVKRIGEITTAGRQQRRQQAAAAVDRDHPVTMDGSEVLDDDDDDGPRTAYRAPSEPVMSPGYRANVADARAQAQPAQAHPSTPPLERTVFIQGDYPAASPASPRAPSQPAIPDPRASRPAWQPMPAQTSPSAPSQPGSIPAALARPYPEQAPQAFAPPAAPRPPMGSVPSFSAADHASVLAVQPSAGMPRSPPEARATPRAQKIALAAVCAVVVLLSVVAILVVVKTKDEGASGVDTTSASAAATNVAATAAPRAPPATAAMPTASAPAADTATATASAEPPPTSTSVPTAAFPTAHTVVAAAPPSTPVTPAATRATAKAKVEPPAAPPPPPPAAAGGGDHGTLVAVAVGGTCAFSVNGASKGTSSSLKLSIKPGTYSVTCAPSAGSSKSKSVTVTSGGTAMAMFKL